MHIFFSGIGGTGIGPLALIAKQAGYEVSGSDKHETQYLPLLRKNGVTTIHVGQTTQAIADLHKKKPIDWLVYSSALPLENPNHPELLYAKEHGIRLSKRDELLNEIIDRKGLELIAVAGTHGKTTTTAMMIWLMQELGDEVSYLVGSNLSFGGMGSYKPGSKYFIYECDEFDRNFLAFHPKLSIITGVSWDHHEIYPTRDDYKEAFAEFIMQSERTVLWDRELDYLGLKPIDQLLVARTTEPAIHDLKVIGHYNRENAWLVIKAARELTNQPLEKLVDIMNRFPGLHRRMEPITPNLYSDEAHTPDKIRGGLSAALELAADRNQKVVIVYEGLTNRRQHYMIDDYKDCFKGAAKVYWIPSYLAREDPKLDIIPPAELIKHLADPTIAEPMERGAKLKAVIQKHLDAGDMVVAMAGGGGGSLDEWIRQEFAS